MLPPTARYPVPSFGEEIIVTDRVIQTDIRNAAHIMS
jgi:hypothetical protein